MTFRIFNLFISFVRVKFKIISRIFHLKEKVRHSAVLLVTTLVTSIWTSVSDLNPEVFRKPEVEVIKTGS